MPPYLAGREHEREEFSKLLQQDTILENLVLTGLRGLGKTVLLETFKPAAIDAGWLWAGTDLSESTSISEENLATRLLTDLAVVTSSITFEYGQARRQPGFPAARDEAPEKTVLRLNYPTLRAVYDGAPGLIADRLKTVLEFTWPHVKAAEKRGIVFAYDEAQNLADHASKGQFPLSLLLDVFQSIQRKNIRFMLALTGLPTLFPKLVEARTYAERMFHIVFLDPLTEEETKSAINKPLAHFPMKITDSFLKNIWNLTRGYPYFVQYVCREVFDIWVQAHNDGTKTPRIPVREIMRKLDSDFFAGRWARATDRQRELLGIVAWLPSCESEFSVQEIIAHEKNKALDKPFSSSHVNQMLVSLTEAGLIYKNRHGKYSFAVPLLGAFIRRQSEQTIPTTGHARFWEEI
jgi:hypothetical protein